MLHSPIPRILALQAIKETTFLPYYTIGKKVAAGQCIQRGLNFYDLLLILLKSVGFVACFDIRLKVDVLY
jgi:hypothetical protein